MVKRGDDAEAVIREFFGELIMALDEGKLDVLPKRSATTQERLTYTLEFRGQTILACADFVLVGTAYIKEDCWALDLVQRLWSACIEREQFQAIDHSRREQSLSASAQAAERQEGYRFLAKTLRSK